MATNGDILSVILYEDYDYVAHSVYLYSKLLLSRQQILSGVTVAIAKEEDLQCLYDPGAISACP